MTETPPTSEQSERSDLLDVVGIGNALVDIIAAVSDRALEKTGLVKGTMELIDLERAQSIHEVMTDPTVASGGSGANTMVGVAELGGTAGYVGMVADDELGQFFTADIRTAGVAYEPVTAPAKASGEGAHGTGRCLVLVTDDAQRTMATHLGAAVAIGPDDLPLNLITRGRLLYLEGYLWDLPAAIEAMRRAANLAHDVDASVALSLSDPFCVERHKREFLELLLDDLDIVFGNEEEVIKLFGAKSFKDAVDALEETGLLAAVTRGAKGSVVITAHGPVEIPAHPVTDVIDTTGAGDLFAAGFLYGLSHGKDPEQCGRLGSLCAAEIISHFGARPERNLAEMAAEAGLL